MPTHTWFYRGMGVLAVAIATAGFLPGLMTPPYPRHPLTPLVAVHALLCAGWLALFLVQSTLVAAERTGVHRRLGWLAAVLAPALVVTGVVTAIVMARRGYTLSGDPDSRRDPLYDMVFSLGDLLSFSLLVGAAMLWRRRRAVHVRLMLLATLGSMMPAAIAHFTGYFPVLRTTPIFIVTSLTVLYAMHAIYDKRTTGRIHPLSLWSVIVMFLYANLRAGMIGPSEAWHRFAAWLIA